MSEADYRRVGGPPIQVQKRPSGSICNHSSGESGIIMSRMSVFRPMGMKEYSIPFGHRALQVDLLCRKNSHRHETHQFGQVDAENRIDPFLVETMLVSETIFRVHSLYPQGF